MLDGLFAAAKASSDLRANTISESDLFLAIENCAPIVDVYRALEPTSNIKIISEIKRRSPSRGFLAEIADPAAQAAIYENSGAHAISVLTEESGFGGSLEDLQAAREAVSIPLLRKDFISNEYQILEARANGADFILLILSWLSEADYRRLYAFAQSLGLGVLVETHSLEEIAIANDSAAKLIGINTRNLNTFQTDIGLYEAMAQALKPGCIRVAESSVKTVADVRRYRDAGADVVLVGEALVTADPAKLIPEFISVS